MKIVEWFSRFRSHDYNRIANASIEISRTTGYEIPRFECKKCGNRLHLELWQMSLLPPAMKYGCNDGNTTSKGKK